MKVTDRCIACMTCIENCPVKAIKLKDGRAFIDKKICIECGLCKSLCPVSAIIEE